MNRHSKPTLLFIVIIILLAGCSSSQPTAEPSSPSAPPPSAAQVSIENLAFNPAQLTVKAGTTVTCTNKDSAPHTVTADDGSWDSGQIAPGGTFAHSFDQAGTFAYHCAIHSSMKATIVVTP